ncbi:MAG: site-specific integrase [Lachnospiraceae bacterium]|nr:site-specific integrase [Lachnospiraceae bacterium]
MASIKKRGSSYLVTVSLGRDSQYRKITKSATFRPDPVTARGHRKTEKSLLKEAEAFAAEFEKKVKTGQILDGEKLTFELYAGKYLKEYAEVFQAPRTLESTRAAIKIFTHDFGHMPIGNLNPLFLQEYVNAMTRTPLRGKPGVLSPGTVRRRTAVLSAMLSQAVRWNLIPSNPMDRVQIQGGAAPEPKTMCFNQEQAEIFLKALDNPLIYEYGARSRAGGHVQGYQSEHQISLQLKLFFYLAMFTGCRRGELIALTWPDIDFNSCSLSVTKSCCRADGQTIIKETKTKGSTRILALPKAVLEIALQWKTQQLRYRLAIGTQWAGDDSVFIRWDGSRMGLDTPYQAFRRIIKNYNANRAPGAPELPEIPLHGLRHTAATLLISRGVDVRTVSGRLGHASTSTTMNIYAEFLKEMDRGASDELEKMLLP